jgi:hypothetical protein
MPTVGEVRPGLQIREDSSTAPGDWPILGWLVRYRVAIESVVIAAALVIAFVLLFLDRTMVQYVDETDNLLGGRLIGRGYRLYVDYFSQHMPMPYYIAALGTRLGINDLVGYRTFFAVLVVLFLGSICLQFRRRISPVFLVAVVLTFGVAHPMFSGYMLLADDVFALALLLLLTLVLVVDVDFSLVEQVVVSLCCWFAIQSTLISIYPILLVAAYYVARKTLRYFHGGRSIDLRREARFLAILLTPHLLVGLWLVTQGAAGSFWDQAVRFNQLYYSRYDIGGDPAGILKTSLTEFKNLAVQYLRPGALREVETFLLISNIVAVGVAWKRRDLLFGVFYAGLVVLSRMRGAGYHGAPYFLVSFASIAIVLAFAADMALGAARRWSAAGGRSRLPGLWEALAGVVLLGYVGLAAVFYHDIAGFYLHLPRSATEVQDVQSAYAAVVQVATAPGDRIWTAPDEPYVYLKADRLPVSTYWFYHPWMADSPEVTEGVLRDLQAGQPPLIVFRADKDVPWNFPLPTLRQYGTRVFAFIQAGYAAIDDQDPLLRDVFVRRDRLDAVRAELQQRGMLPPASAPAAGDRPGTD